MADLDARNVADARRGDLTAIGALFDTHWASAYRIAYGITGSTASAEDIAQDAFLAAIDRLGTFDGRQPFAAWLRRITVNRALDVARREARRTAAPDRPKDSESGEFGTDPFLRRALLRLDEDRRVALTLRYGLDLTPTEIAAALDIPVGTVNSRLARGLADLRHRLETGNG